MTAKILAFAGSLRRDSYNRRLLPFAVAGAKDAGAEVTVIDLADYPLPVMDQNLEDRDGLPDNARKLKKLFKSHRGLLLACPEYNSSITPLLKNTIDWVSRQDGAESGSVPYKNKIAALVSASDGRWGGMRGLRHVREVLTTLGCVVLPEQYMLSGAEAAFDQQNLRDDKTRKAVEAVGAKLAGTLRQWTST